MTCVSCGKEFVISATDFSRGRGKYCSRECLYKDMRGVKSYLWKGGKPQLECEICGSLFESYTGMGKKYCSDQCQMIARARPRPGQKTGQTVSCEICSKEFYISRSRTDRSIRVFCSQECAGIAKQKPCIEHTCKTCGKTFEVKPARERAGNPTYCNLKCRDADPDYLEGLRRRNLEQQYRFPNKLETKGYEILDSIGCDYRKQYFLENLYAVDAYIPSHRIVIEFDGDYWHGNPAKYRREGTVPQVESKKFRPLNKVQLNHMRIDKSKNTFFQNRGYMVLRFWESDVKTDPGEVRQRILASLDEENIS